MIEKANIANLYRLSPLQGGMLFHALLDEGEGLYFEQILLEVTGELDPLLFEESWNILVDRHDALRTAFVVKGVPEPLQIVLKQRPVPFRVVDLREEDEDAREERINQLRREDRAAGFDLMNDPLLRITLVRSGILRQVMIMSFHHIIMDGWCQGILASELLEIYTSRVAGRPAALPPAPQFREYIRWIEGKKTSDPDGGLNYWSDYLEGFVEPTEFPKLHPNSGTDQRGGSHERQERFNYQIDCDLTQQVQTYAQSIGVTVSSVLQGLLGTLLAAYNNRREGLFLATVSGRPSDLPNAQSIVGLFINALPVRLRWDRSTSVEELFQSVHRELGTSLNYQQTPLAEIQGTTPIAGSIANTLLVVENYPFTEDPEAPLQFRSLDASEATNYDLTIQVHLQELIEIEFGWERGTIDRQTVSDAAEWIARELRRIVEGDVTLVDRLAFDQLVHDVQQLSDSEKIYTRAFLEQFRTRGGTPLQIHIASTFTVEPILPWLSWWTSMMGEKAEITVAPYNQVFQELLDPSRPLATGDPIGLLALRPDDWIREMLGKRGVQEIIDHLERSTDDYLRLIDRYSGRSELLQLLLPADRSALDRQLVDELERLEELLLGELQRRPHIRLLDGRRMAERYRISQPFDRIADAAGHVPYTPEMNSAIGTLVARTLLSRNRPPFKAIVLDCDNTLWQGICGEDGATGVDVTPPFRRFQEFLIERYQDGVLLLLNSKNNEADVREVFETNSGMLLTLDHIVDYQINWQPKSENLKELASRLSLGLDSFLFIDDNPMEIAEVRENGPDVFSLLFPQHGEGIEQLIDHLWGLDVWSLTDEDRNRSIMYVAERKRKEGEEESGSMESFLAGLDLTITMVPGTAGDIPRLSQLTQRTNQFNISTIRRDEAEIASLLADPDVHCWKLIVDDRFGSYGLVGLVICRAEGERGIVDTVLLSCRVLGRGVEQGILAGVRAWSLEKGVRSIEARFVRTERNLPGLSFMKMWPGEVEVLQGVEGDVIDLENDGVPVGAQLLFTTAVEDLPVSIPHGTFSFSMVEREESEEESMRIGATVDMKQFDPSKTMNSSATVRTDEAGASVDPFDHTTNVLATDHASDYELDLHDLTSLRHRVYYLPIAFNSGAKLVRLPVEPGRSTEATREYAHPERSEEIEVCRLFERVLRTGQIGMEDNFFERGGNSLRAVELLSVLHSSFATDISLRQIFDAPTPRQLLAQIEASANEGFHRTEPIPVLPDAPFYPLSFAQQRLWLLNDLQSASTSYLMGGGTMIEGRLDVDRLEAAFRGIIARHESLRTGIVETPDGPMQTVAASPDFSIERIDLTQIRFAPGQKKKLVDSLMRERSTRPFDLAQPPLLRVTFIATEQNRGLLLIYLHHIVADGWSFPILMEELVQLYQSEGTENGGSKLGDLPVQYRDYAAWQRQMMERPLYRADEEFWLAELAAPRPTLDFPTDRSRPADPTFAGGSRSIAFDVDRLRQIEELCNQSGSTLFIYLLASVRLLLWRYTGQKETIIGVPVAGRYHPDLTDQIGFYVNTLAMRGSVDPERTFAENLERTRENVLEAFSHQTTPFDHLIQNLDNVERESGRSPLFDVMVVLQNNRQTDTSIDGLRFEPYGEEAGAGKFDLVFNFSEQPNGLDCRIEYRTELFDQTTIDAVAEELNRVINAGLQATRPFLIAHTAIRHLREEIAATAAVELPEGTIHGLVEEITTRRCDHIALEQGGIGITYRELEERCSGVSRWLTAGGYRSGDVVAVVMKKSIDQVTALLGIMKSGSLYLPIDPDYPRERILTTIERSGAKVVIAEEGRTYGECRVVSVREMLIDREELEDSISSTPAVSPADPAYVIYTSGSTGEPKGVVVSHRSFVNMISRQIETFGLVESDRIVQFASTAFDASLSELFMGLGVGATVLLPQREQVEDPEAFIRFLAEEEITGATIPPVYLRALAGAPLPSLRFLITAGEEAPVEQVAHYLQQTTADDLNGAHRLRIFNAYGPTEGAVCATIHEVEPDDHTARSIPIGRPIAGTGAYIADENLIPRPAGATGELILYGAGLAEGYLNDPERTAERFVAPEWDPDLRTYRTGDLVRQNIDGSFTYIGRLDQQAKVRGHRVEPEELRQALLSSPVVDEAVVLIVRPEETRNLWTENELVAFVIGSGIVTEEETRRLSSWLRSRLPKWLMPNVILPIESIPMTINGKIDIEQLKGVVRDHITATGEIRRDDRSGVPTAEEHQIETALRNAFVAVLNRNDIPRDGNFFEYGGDSLKAIRLRTFLETEGYSIETREIYERGSIGAIAPFVNVVTTETGLSRAAEVVGDIPLTPVQEWAFRRLGVDRFAALTLPLVAETTEQISSEHLRDAIEQLVIRYDALRITAWIEDGQLHQQVREEVDSIIIEELDLRQQTESSEAEGMEVRIRQGLERFVGSIDLQKNHPLFHIGSIHYPGGTILVWNFHHLIIDAVSIDILLDELNQLYRAEVEGVTPTLGPTGDPYGSWAVQIRRLNEELSADRTDFWKHVLEEMEQGPHHPLLRKGDQTQKLLTERCDHSIELSTEQTGQVQRLGRESIGVHHLLLVALRRTLESVPEHLFHSEAPLSVALEGHGRDTQLPVDVARTVGWMTTIAPLILRRGKGSARSALADVAASLNEIEGRREEYLLRAEEQEKGEASGRGEPVISFNYLGDYGSREYGVAQSRTFDYSLRNVATSGTRLHDVEVNGLIEENRLKVILSVADGMPELLSTTFANRFESTLLELVAELSDEVEVSGTVSSCRIDGDPESASLRIIALPFVAGDADAYRELASFLPSGVAMITSEGAGHGARVGESPYRTVGEIADDHLASIAPWLVEPYILMGHSLGGIVAYELLRRISAARLPAPVRLVISACQAPDLFGSNRERGGSLDMNQLRAFFEDRAARLPDLPSNYVEGSVESAIADMEAADSYAAESTEPINLPLSLMYGSDDSVMLADQIAWQQCTTQPLTIQQIEGEHDFIRTSAAEVAEFILKEARYEAGASEWSGDSGDAESDSLFGREGVPAADRSNVGIAVEPFHSVVAEEKA